MVSRFRFLFLLAIGCTILPARSPAPVVFGPGQNAKYELPGEEEISGNAEQLFKKAEDAEVAGDRTRAIKAYRTLVKKYPRSTLASGSLFRLAKLTEEKGDLLRAAGYYRGLMELYPNTQHFTEAIEAQFRIGEVYLAGKKIRIAGVPITTSMDDAVNIFAAIVRSAPYGSYTARAQYDIGRAREKQGEDQLAIAAYEAVVEKYPNDPLAVDSQYQIGYIYMKAARKKGSYDANAAAQARTAFQDFLFRFPKSEKVPQAQQNLRLLEQHQSRSSMDIARFYDKKRYYRAAVIYYNEVIRDQPGSPESVAAKKRIDQLRAKYGDAALQSAATAAELEAKKHPQPKAPVAGGAPGLVTPPTEEHEAARPQMRGNPADVAPLPPAADSLPPPAAADTSPAPDAGASPAASPTPAASGTP